RGRRRDPFEEDGRQRDGREEREDEERRERGDPRDLRVLAAAAPLAQRDPEEHEDDGARDRDRGRLPPTEKERQQQDESLQGREHDAIETAHARTSAGSAVADGLA